MKPSRPWTVWNSKTLKSATDLFGAIMIKLKNLEKVYRTTDVETTALRDINLDVAAGEFVAVMGAFGLRQVDVPHHRRHAGQSLRRRILVRQRKYRGLFRDSAFRPAQEFPRLRVPELQPDRRAERLRKRRAGASLSSGRF